MGADSMPQIGVFFSLTFVLIFRGPPTTGIRTGPAHTAIMLHVAEFELTYYI